MPSNSLKLKGKKNRYGKDNQHQPLKKKASRTIANTAIAAQIAFTATFGKSASTIPFIIRQTAPKKFSK